MCNCKGKIPGLANYKLNTIAKELSLPEFKHHSAEDDALVCANIVLHLLKNNDNDEKKHSVPSNMKMEYKGLIMGILADDCVNYKEALNLLYWMEDNKELSQEYHYMYITLKGFCDDKVIDVNEERILINMLKSELDNGNKNGWKNPIIP